jgi:hypothetical protein
MAVAQQVAAVHRPGFACRRRGSLAGTADRTSREQPERQNLGEPLDL